LSVWFNFNRSSPASFVKKVMKLMIIGANGTVGTQLLLQALGRGYQVRAFVRNAEKINSIQHGNLEVCIGDVFNVSDISRNIKQVDAVLCALGDGRIGRVRAAGTKNIIAAMTENRVRRLICQTTLGCGDSRGNLNFFWRRIMFGWFLKKAFVDHELQEQYVLSSELEWTVVRPSAFAKGIFTGKYQHGFGGDQTGLQLKITPADVASFMLDQLNTNQYLHKTTSISY
jgi:putative NADH-flavin reductase